MLPTRAEVLPASWGACSLYSGTAVCGNAEPACFGAWGLPLSPGAQLVCLSQGPRPQGGSLESSSPGPVAGVPQGQRPSRTEAALLLSPGRGHLVGMMMMMSPFPRLMSPLLAAAISCPSPPAALNRCTPFPGSGTPWKSTRRPPSPSRKCMMSTSESVAGEGACGGGALAAFRPHPLQQPLGLVPFGSVYRAAPPSGCQRCCRMGHTRLP